VHMDSICGVIDDCSEVYGLVMRSTLPLVSWLELVGFCNHFAQG
jgi:hypothetical protein